MTNAISVKVIGNKKLSSTLKKKIKKINEADRGLGEGAFRVEKDAKIGSPIDRGALRSSIHTTKIKFLTWKVSDGVNYGIFQEFGFRNVPGKHFMQKAAKKNSKFIGKQVAKVYE